LPIFIMETVNDVQVWLEESGFSDYKAKFMGRLACFVLLEWSITPCAQKSPLLFNIMFYIWIFSDSALLCIGTLLSVLEYFHFCLCFLNFYNFFTLYSPHVLSLSGEIHKVLQGWFRSWFFPHAKWSIITSNTLYQMCSFLIFGMLRPN